MTIKTDWMAQESKSPAGGSAIIERSLRARLLIWTGSLGPLGYLPASGTATVAIVGIPLFWATRSIPVPWYLAFVVVFCLAAVWLHQRCDRLLGTEDSGILVWDEIAGFLIATVALPFTWKIAMVAFFLERGLDILKVPPAKQIEDRWPGGWGVVGDDVVAGVYSLLLLDTMLYLAPGFFL